MFSSRHRHSSLLFFFLLLACDCSAAISKSAIQKQSSSAHQAASHKFQTTPLATGDTWVYRTTEETDGKLSSVEFSRYKLGGTNQKNQFLVSITVEPDLPFSRSEGTEDAGYSIDTDACMVDFLDKTSLVKELSCQAIFNEESAWDFEFIRDGLRITRKFMTLGHEPIQILDKTYDAVRIESISAIASGAPGVAPASIDDPRAFHTTYWYVPEFRAVVKKVAESSPASSISLKFTSELVWYVSAKPGDEKTPVAGSTDGNQSPKVIMVDDDSESRRACASPSYPDEAARYNLEGQDILALLIDSEGKVAEWKILKSSGWKILDEAAIRLFSGCNYETPTENGERVSAWKKIRYVWKMPEKDSTRIAPSLIQNSCAPSENLSFVNEQSRQASIRLRLLVNAKGKPFGIKIEDSSGNEKIDKMALDLIKTCRFTPETLNGKPTEGALSVRLATSP